MQKIYSRLKVVSLKMLLACHSALTSKWLKVIKLCYGYDKFKVLGITTKILLDNLAFVKACIVLTSVCAGL